MNNRLFWRLFIYGLPLVVCTIFVFRYSSGEHGLYEDSWKMLQLGLHFLTPEWPYQPNGNGLVLTVSMYQVNDAFRRIAHVVLYAVLTFLLVRMIQQGRSRLKPASLIAAFLVSGLYIAADEFKKTQEPYRHAKSEDIFLDLIGIGLVLGGTVAFFGIKAIERYLADDAPKPTP